MLLLVCIFGRTTCYAVGNVAGIGFGNGGVVGVLAALVHLPGSAQRNQTGRLNTHGHLRQNKRNGLVLWNERRKEV